MTIKASKQTKPRPTLGLALGGGGALGFAHIGVIKALQDRGVQPDAVAGTSIGAIVGAAYVFGKLGQMEELISQINALDMIQHIDLKLWKPGLIGGDRIVDLIVQQIGDVRFEDAAIPFAVIAADLTHDREVLIRSGPVAEGIRASISLPGIFTPIQQGDALLIDGGMKNPVPISACRALGAERVIAVDVTGDYEGQAHAVGIKPGVPFNGGIVELGTVAFRMIMKELAQARAVIHPADVTVVPKIGHVKPYDFNRAEELIAAGRAATEKEWPQIETLLRADRADQRPAPKAALD